jgi:serine/threonine protein kinase
LSPEIPDHQLLRLIARGSYGEVWLARSALGAYRAVKIVFEHTFRDKRPFERELAGVQRFEPVSRLHEGLMDVLQVGRNEEAGYFYCVMELADDVSRGQAIQPDTYVPHTLAREVVKQKRLPFERCLQVGITLASALEFLHAHGLIHRDVKPSNIVFINGTPKLVDIGLVAEMSEARSYVGTEGFIPPEGPGTVQADVYSLGKVLYEISTGKDRYDYPELPTLLDETTHDTELIGLNQVILRACRSDPRQRYQSASQMLRDLRALQGGRPVSRRPGEHPRFRVGTRLVGSVALVAMCLVLFGRMRHPARLHGGGEGVSSTGSILAPSGLVSWWRAEHNSKDSGFARNDGTLLPGTAYRTGLVGTAFMFDGTNSGIVIPPSPDLAVESLTFEVWVLPEEVDQPRPIMEYADPTGHSYVHLWYGITAAPGGAVGAPGAVYGLVRDPAGAVLQVGTIRHLLSSNHWNHVALTYDVAARTALIYVNGTVVGSNTSSVVVQPRTLVQVNLGFRSDASSELLPGARHLGLLDEASIYNRALRPAEILSIYHAGAHGKQIAGSGGSGLTIRPIIAPTGLVSWWRAEGDASDATGRNPGVLLHGASFAPGKSGQSFRLDGKEACVHVTSSTSLNLTNSLSLEAWVYVVEFSENDGVAIAGKDDPYAVRQYLLGLGKIFGQWVFRAHIGVANEFRYFNGNTPALSNTWYHIAMTYDGAFLKLYVNGKLDGSAGVSGPVLTSDQPLVIGGESPGPWNFNGLIDEVSLYDRALSEAEVSSIYQAGSAGKRLQTAGFRER